MAAPLTTPTPTLNAISGENVAQYEARLGAQSTRTPGAGFGTPVAPQPVTDLNTAHDEVAKQLGFNSYQDALTTLGAPSDDTTSFYNTAYSAAGLDELANKITSRQNDLTGATGKINDNPWLDEASRVGRVRNLTSLATADIKNLQDEYNTKLKSVHDLATQHADELKNTTANNKAKLALLESQAKALAAEAATTAKTAATPPKTIKGANGATFQWNPTTNTFDPILPGKNPASQSSDFNFTPKQLLSLQTRGLPSDAANNVLAGIKQNIPFEQIRQNMKAAGYDRAVLDEIMYYVDPKHNTPSKSSAPAPALPPGVSLGNTRSTQTFA